MPISLHARHIVEAGLISVLLVFSLGCAGSNEAQNQKPSIMMRDSLGINEIRQIEADRVEDLLIGRVAGVQVKHTSAGLQVEIRGPSSIFGSTEPLYVVDGMPIQAQPGGALQGINPRDIESIRVLKNASDTSMYGVRGANGVVVITTKRGERND